jgi:beta-glucosidase
LAGPYLVSNLARTSDVAVVFAYQWQSEGMDLPDLSLPDNQDALIEQVAAANPHTIVVLETGTAVTMPWINKVAAVVEAWYAGSAGHKALADILVGDVNPSGKLAMTFPKSESDLPRPGIPPPPANDEGQGTGSVNSGTHISSYAVHYDEGPEVGYKWYEAQRKQPLFAFGFGLSYTSYTYSGLSVDSSAKTVRFTVKNVGTRTGTEIAEVYATLPKGADESFKRLVGWKRVTLEPGESQIVTIAINPRILQTFDESRGAWNFAAGGYGVFVGSSSDSTPLTGSLQVR